MTGLAEPEHSDITSIIPVIGDWEVVFASIEDDGAVSRSEPVIAWGLTAAGGAIPITQTYPDGISGLGLRKSGATRAWVDGIEHGGQAARLLFLGVAVPGEGAK